MYSWTAEFTKKAQKVRELTNKIRLKEDNKAPGEQGGAVNEAHAARNLGICVNQF